MTFLERRVSELQSTVDELRAGRGGYVYLIDGALMVNDQHLTGGDAAYLGAGELTLRGERQSDLILVDTPL